jgi:hypothetical protein
MRLRRLLRRRGRPGDRGAHQGCLTEDHAFLLANDELDEQEFDTNTRTIVVEVRDLQNPTVHFEHFHDTYSIDHNNYVHEGLAYESNYTSGLRVLDAVVVRAPGGGPIASGVAAQSWIDDDTATGPPARLTRSSSDGTIQLAPWWRPS